ncbi:MAG TPA: fluoride efflux transporter CrcB [Gemmatimonadaceae bacterium]|nr:fluoride efflux transporter CrcB [Gemmatimonadaceae bacterium]
MVALVIFVGAGLGGLARYGVSGWVQGIGGAGFPWGTLLVNVTGSLLLGFVYAFLEGTAAAPEWRAFLGIGVLGGYTTFSTFSYETLRLAQDGQWERALLYAGGSVLLSLAGAVLGLRLASVVLARG